MSTHQAPAKLNLCLYLGHRRQDGYHDLASIFEPLSLHDILRVSSAGQDEVICEGVDGENLATRALQLLRSEGWQADPVRIEIEKNIPVAAGLGGGSADAAAVLRLAGGEVDDLAGIAALVGADVPSQIDPMACLVEGIGQKLTSLPEPAEHWVVLITFDEGLATGDVFAEADRLGVGRSAEDLEEISGRLWAVASGGVSPLAYPSLLVNDLEPAAMALHSGIGPAMDRLALAGAGFVGMTGSGPTVFGICPTREAADAVAGEVGPGTLVCRGGIGS